MSLKNLRGTAIAGLLLAALFAPAAGAHSFQAGTLDIKHPWSRATPPAAKVGGGYLVVVNTGEVPDRLVSVTAPDITDRAEIHEMKEANGVMTMRRVEGGLDVPAGGELALKPGGYHLMFFGLKRPLKQGDRVAGTLTFEKAGTVPVEFAVEAMGAGGEHSGH